MATKENDQSKDFIGKENTKMKKDKVLKIFKTLKEENKLDKSNLKLLLSNCDTIEEIIVYYLDFLRLTKDKDYIPELISYYTIISPEACKKYSINKESEKDRFHHLMDCCINKNNLKDIAEKEFFSCADEVRHIFNEEIKDLNDKEILEKKEKEFSRWNIIYNSDIDFYDIYNEEYFYYKLSNSILENYFEGKIGVITRGNGIKIFYEVFKLIEPYKDKYKEYFEYICIGLLNVSIKEENCKEIPYIVKCIKNKLNGEKYLSLDEIKKILDKKKVEYSLNKNQLKIKYNNKNYIIDNYNNYDFKKRTISSILNDEDENSYKDYLFLRRSFNFFINKENYFDGLLIKVILNYVKSNFSKNSIEYLFKINENTHSELFNEVTTDKILNYIIFIPYNNIFDSARTLKIHSKIIMDPLKNLFEESLSPKLLSLKLKKSLRLFVNITKRKYLFEHEQHHLITILLFYLYINENRRITSIAREINEDKIIFLSDEEYNKKKVNQKNVIKEAGWSFELFCYGKIQRQFKIKELLFIANELNDNLDCITHKKEYEKYTEKSLEQLLEEFPTDQPLSNLVKEIKEGLVEEQSLILEKENLKKKYDEILNTFVSRLEDDSLSSLVDFQNVVVDIKEESYNNHILDKKYLK